MDQQHETLTRHPVRFLVHYQEDGVYLTLPLENIADTLQPMAVVTDLQRRGIQGIKPGDLMVRLRKGQEAIRVADPQEERDTDASLYIWLSGDAMRANAQLFPPTGGGKILGVADALAQVQAAGVRFGLDEEALRRLVETQTYYRTEEIARGQEPVRGEDGYIDFLFEMEHSSKPTLLEDGSVDYKNLKLFTSVVQGQEVARRHPPGPGVPGMNVKGDTVDPTPGAEVKLPGGYNVLLSEDGNALLAEKDGRVDFMDNRVVISNVFTISGDVDMSVGNVEFAGDLLVEGNVISGLELKATGNIEVRGTVEGARLEAGGNIILHNGIQGMDKGELLAQGEILSNFIARCRVRAGGNIRSDYIVHADVETQGSVEVSGKRGRIIGGRVCALGVSAKAIGSSSGEKTLIEMGNAAQVRTGLAEASAQAEQIHQQMEKVNQMLRVQEKREDTPDNRALVEKMRQGKAQIAASYESASQELEGWRDLINRMHSSKISVSGMVYQDVKITIDSAVYTTRTAMEYVTFRFDGGDVAFGPFEG